MDWWKQNHESFPLLSLYWRAYSSFPATSTSAERSFNMNGLILTPNPAGTNTHDICFMVICIFTGSHSYLTAPTMCVPIVPLPLAAQLVM